MRKNPAEICRRLQKMARGVGKTIGTHTSAKVQDLQLEVTDLKMDLEVAYKKIDKLEEVVRQYEYVPF